MSDKFLKSSFKRTQARPIDALSVINSINTVNTEIPSALRYESFQFYSLSNHKFYYFNQNLEAVEDTRGGGGESTPQINCIDWKVTATESGTSRVYYNYTELKTFLETYVATYLKQFSTSVDNVMRIRVLPLDAVFIIKKTTTGYSINFDFRNNKRIYISYVNMSLSNGGPEFASLIVGFTASEFAANLDADVDYTTGISTTSQPLTAGTALRYNGISLVPFACPVSSVSVFFNGRIYKDGTTYMIYNKGENIIVGGGSGNQSYGYQIVANRSIVKSDWYTSLDTMSKPFGLVEEKNVIQVTALTECVRSVKMLHLSSTGVYELVDMEYVFKIVSGTAYIVIKSEYAFSALAILIEYLL